MRSPRKTLIPVLEIVTLALVLVDVVLGFSAAWVKSRLATRQELLATTQRHVFEEQARVASLEKFQALLPGAEGQLELFRSNHLSPRRLVFAHAARLIRQLSDGSGVQLTTVSYKLDPKHDAPLDRLGLEAGVVGSFPALIDFSHALETAGDFIVVRNFIFTRGENGKLALRLGADLYMTP